MEGKVVAICVSAEKGQPKLAVAQSTLVANHGLDGDAHAGPWHRQVSVLGHADVEAFKSRGLATLAPGAFGENLLLDGVDLSALGVGSELRLGRDVVLQVTQLGKTCHDRCAIYHQVGDCIMPRLGLFARVRAGGRLSVADTVQVERLVPRAAIVAVVITLSDRCSRGEAEDTAGPAVAQLLERELGAHIYKAELLPDDKAALVARLRHYAAGHSIDLVLAVGGTGFAPRDVTPEAVREVALRLTPGLDEAMRRASAEVTPHAWLSRAVSGIREQTLIVSLPGSRRAATENLQAILGVLPHGLAKLRGDLAPCASHDAP